MLNLVLAVAMPGTTILTFYMGTSFEEATLRETGDPPIVPAGYAFIIWAFIYAGSIAYAVFQALPGQQENELLGRIGFFTASAFLATSIWLLAAPFGFIWGTVACIVWILFSLGAAFYPLIPLEAPVPAAERYLVVMLISVFTGWVTVATFANVSAALRASGWSNVGLTEEAWTILLLLAAAAIAALVTIASRGNVWYAGTIVWALVAIVIANLTREVSLRIAGVAGALVVVIAIALLWVRAGEIRDWT